MNTALYLTKLSFVFTLLFMGLAVPQVYAARIFFSTSPATPAAGETFTILVHLDTGADSVNAVEGSLDLGTLRVERVHTGGSALSLWPSEPKYSLGSHTVEFAGGVPGGIAEGKEVQLFSIEAQAPAAGTYTVSSASVRAFKNDGKGSAVAVAPASKKISVTSENAEPAAAKPKDTTAPQFVSLEVGQDSSLFDGRQYVSFFATDEGSGVTRYQVKEGWFSLYHDADRYYVLADQDRGSDIWVRATDDAGNTVTKKIPSEHGTSAWRWIAGGILILLAFTLMYRRLRKKHF